MGEGRARCLACINSLDNSCYLLRASPPSNKHLMGASRVPGAVPGRLNPPKFFLPSLSSPLGLDLLWATRPVPFFGRRN